MEKVKLPYEVVEALKEYSIWGQETLFQEIVGIERVHEPTTKIILLHDYFKSVGFLFLAKAIFNGYEIEKTPEDKVRDYYDAHKSTDLPVDKYTRKAIVVTLNLLDIQIEGVNT